MSGSTERERAVEADLLQDLDKLPDDLLYVIFKPMFHSDAGNLCAVSKGWRDRFQPPCHLWDDVELTIHRQADGSAVSEQRLAEVAVWLKKRMPVARRLRLMLDHESFADWSGEETVLRREMVEAFKSTKLQALEITIPYCSHLPGDFKLLAPWLTTLKSLTIRDGSRNENIKQLDGLQALTGLTELRQLFVNTDVAYNKITAFPSALLALTQLRELAVVTTRAHRNCSGAVPDLSSLGKLQALELTGFRVRNDVLAGLSNLTSIRLSRKLHNEDVEGLQFPLSLRQTHLHCHKVLPGLAACTALTRLELFIPQSFEDRNSVNSCICCQGLASVLWKLPSLERLSLKHFDHAAFPAIASLKKLQHLDIRLRYNDFEGLLDGLLEGDWITRLKVLRLGRVKALPMRLAKAANLEVLDLSVTHIEADSVKTLKVMLRLPKLKQVIWPYFSRKFGVRFEDCGDQRHNWAKRVGGKLQQLLIASNPHLYHDHDNRLVTYPQRNPDLEEMKSLTAEVWPKPAS